MGNDRLLFNTDYETVAASQTDQVLGPNGNKGDILESIVIIPETVAAGTISIKDGSVSVGNIFVTGTLSNLQPFTVFLGMRSVNGGWKVTTGANVHCIGVGRFT